MYPASVSPCTRWRSSTGPSVELLLAVTVATLWSMHRARVAPAVLRRGEVLLVVLVAQAAVGYSQYLSGDPVLLVGIHLAGATSVVIAMVLFNLGLYTRDPAPAAQICAGDRRGSQRTGPDLAEVRMAASAPLEVKEPEVTEVTGLSRPWKVIVWNDPINLMSYVAFVFQKLFGYSKEKANKLMMDVHTKGKAVVSSGPREKSELDVFRLHEHGLWATMEQDS